MGEIKRKRKRFSKPRRLFERTRIDEENVIVEKYGLKNKREIWKAKSKVSDFRKRAKELIGSDIEEQKQFFEKLNKLGLNVQDISDVLALTEEDLLKRRLETIVFKKGLANTPKQARQLIVHKHVLVGGIIVNVPSFWVKMEDEEKIELKPKKEKKNEVVQETQEDVPQEINLEDKTE